MRKILFILCVLSNSSMLAQTPVNPVIKSYGTIKEVPFATVKADPSLEYNIVIDIMNAAPSPEQVNPSLDNVARLLNLHAVAGVPKEKMHVVLAIHNESAFTLVNNETYQKKYKTDNPNLNLLKELHNAGVTITVCGQSLFKRNIDHATLVPQAEVAVSMLTTITTHQLKGYAVLKF